jgi:acyl-CoA thioester hydrolase
MARIQIELPPKRIFTTEIAVRVSDLNYGGHVGHDSILTLMQEARVTFYRSIGIKDEVSIEGNVGQIITDAGLQYKSESFLGDVLLFHIGLDDFSRYGFDMYYEVVNKTSGKEVARGKTGIVCFDYDRKKVASIPEKFLTKLKELSHI